MAGYNHIWIAVPVFNHATSLPAVISGILPHTAQVIVVDDGSTDAEISTMLAGQPVTVLVHSRNLGKGAALRTAARWIAAHGGEYMITLDADGQHDPADLVRFFPLLTPDSTTLVVGVRDFAGYVPWRSRLGRRLSNLMIRFATGIAVADSQSGFRAYPVRWLTTLPSCPAEGFAYETEVLVRSCRDGLPVLQVPVTVHYPPPKQRISHFSWWRDTLAIARVHFRLLCNWR